MRFSLTIFLSFALISCFAQYEPHVGQVGCTAIKNTNTAIIGWATECTIERGWLDAADTTLGKVSYGDAENAIGSSSPAVVSLGDGGVATLTFDVPITNLQGFDFAVFENAFDDYFLELAHVEVSSDGQYFVRFPSFSLTSTDAQIDPYGVLATEKIHNLAGKYRARFGTPFDLEELSDCTLVDINNINYVRVIDVIGSVNPNVGSVDSEGNLINDPYPTNFPNGGFDLDAVAVLDMSLASFEEAIMNPFIISPNPALKGQVVRFSKEGHLYDVQGNELNVLGNEVILNAGFYFYQTIDGEVQKLVVH